VDSNDGDNVKKNNSTTTTTTTTNTTTTTTTSTSTTITTTTPIISITSVSTTFTQPQNNNYKKIQPKIISLKGLIEEKKTISTSIDSTTIAITSITTVTTNTVALLTTNSNTNLNEKLFNRIKEKHISTTTTTTTTSTTIFTSTSSQFVIRNNINTSTEKNYVSDNGWIRWGVPPKIISIDPIFGGYNREGQNIFFSRGYVGWIVLGLLIFLCVSICALCICITCFLCVYFKNNSRLVNVQPNIT
jgi:hypothetical protein